MYAHVKMRRRECMLWHNLSNVAALHAHTRNVAETNKLAPHSMQDPTTPEWTLLKRPFWIAMASRHQTQRGSGTRPNQASVKKLSMALMPHSQSDAWWCMCNDFWKRKSENEYRIAFKRLPQATNHKPALPSAKLMFHQVQLLSRFEAIATRSV